MCFNQKKGKYNSKLNCYDERKGECKQTVTSNQI